MTAMTWRTPTTARSASSTSSATRGATPVSLEIYAEFAAVRPNSREACTRLGTAPSLATGSIRRGSRPGIGGSGDEEEGSDGVGLRARRNAEGGDSLGWHGRMSPYTRSRK